MLISEILMILMQILQIDFLFFVFSFDLLFIQLIVIYAINENFISLKAQIFIFYLSSN
jgi:hypothetical protein